MAGYHEVPESRAGTPLRFAVAVRQDGASVPTTAGSSSVEVAGRFDWRALQGGSLTVTSAAETFFARPQPRDDGKDELATLFRPYWQARRVAVTNAESLAARRLP